MLSVKNVGIGEIGTIEKAMIPKGIGILKTIYSSVKLPQNVVVCYLFFHFSETFLSKFGKEISEYALRGQYINRY
jgi:hypothetical protein